MEEQLRGVFLRSVEEFFNYLHDKNVSYIFAIEKRLERKETRERDHHEIMAFYY